MTTENPSVSEVSTLRLGDQAFRFTPIMAVVKRTADLENMMAEAMDQGPTVERSERMKDLLYYIMRRGTERDHHWETVEEACDSFTFSELVEALRAMVEEKNAELDFMTRSTAPETAGSRSGS